MSAPDFSAPVLGFRAWRMGDDAALIPWSAGIAGPWVPGINEARCVQHDTPDHVPPGRSCTCGIYALADWRDHRLLPLEQAVGAIAAWGEVEVHRTGFRAQFACVVALGVPDGCPARHLVALEMAAEHYDVPLVGLADLERIASEYAQPLVFDAVPLSPRPVAQPTNPGPPLVASSDGLHGIACDDHVWLRVERGAVVAGITRALAGEMEIGSPVRVAEPGVLSAGDALARIGTGDGELRVGSPVSAWSVEENPALREDPDLVRTHPEGSGWLARLTPSHWAQEGGSLAWGPNANRIYASSMARERRHGDAFIGVRARWLRAHAHVSSFEAVLDELRAARLRPRFGSAEELRRRMVGPLSRALARPDVGARVGRAGVRVAWRLREPEVGLVLDLRGPVPSVTVDEAGLDDITLSASAETADDYFLGRVDLAAALRSGLVTSSCPAARVLAVESVIKSLHRAYAAEAA